VFVDNVSVGLTPNTGELLLEGVQSGNHHLRISHNGFRDWLGDVVCDGKPQQVIAELQPGDSRSAIQMPTEVLPAGSIQTQYGASPNRTMTNDALEMTLASNYGGQSAAVPE